MKNILLLLLLVFIVTNLNAQTTRRQLTVALYPFIPNADKFYRIIETQFEQRNRDIDLVIKLNSDYYDEDKGIINDNADIYELDCVFLNDFIRKNKIRSINNEFFLKTEILPAANVVYYEDKLFAVPHWLCGNFLFFNKNDNAIQKIYNLKSLENTIGISPNLQGGILIDLKGRLTIGEMYIDALFDEYVVENTALKFADINNLDTLTISNINKIPKMTFSDWGRNDDYHNKIGFYPKQFAKNNGRILVGYSESLYYVIDEILNACSNDENCFVQSNIDIKDWSLSNKGSTPVGWVDALTINSKISGQNLKDAINFINYFISTDTYHLALIPDFGEAPRYLLPPYKKYYSDSLILEKAPLYLKLKPLAEKIHSFTAPNISPNLRLIGRDIDKNRLEN